MSFLSFKVSSYPFAFSIGVCPAQCFLLSSVSKYKVEWDTSSSFDSVNHGSTMLSPSEALSPSLTSMSEIQTISVSSPIASSFLPSYPYLAGHFTISVDGRRSSPLSPQCSAKRMEEVVNALLTDNDRVVVRRNRGAQVGENLS